MDVSKIVFRTFYISEASIKMNNRTINAIQKTLMLRFTNTVMYFDESDHIKW